MFITITKTGRGFEVKDADMRIALRGLYRSLRNSGRSVAECRRQAGKMVQFGLYNSEKVQHDLTAAVQQSLAV